MQAIAIAPDRSLKLIERDDAPLDAGQVRVAVSVCGICGTDLHLKDVPAVPPGTIMGHEFSGVLEEVAPDVTGWAVGDRVVIFPFSPCGRCSACRAGQEHLCPTALATGIGLGARPGGYAERVVVDAAMLERLPDHVSAEAAALAEPLAVGVHGVGLAQARHQHPSVVFGAGPVGVMTAIALRELRNGDPIVIEPRERRRQFMQRLGFTAITPGEYSGAPPDLIFDCTGHPAGTAAAVTIAAPHAEIVILGVAVEPTPLSTLSVVTRELVLRGSFAYRRAEFAQALALLASGAVEVSDVITTVAPLEEANARFLDLLSGRSGDVKVLLRP